MLTSEDLTFFLGVAADDSLAAAARRMNVTASAVTQRLKALETKLGMRLTQRNGRSLLLTDEGRLLCATGGDLMRQLDMLNEELMSRRKIVSGRLRVIAPFGFGRQIIAPLCVDFQESYPDVAIDLFLTDRIGRYPDQTWDLAIHVGELAPTGLKMRTLARNQRYVCASPAYIAAHGSPSTPADLVHHRCLVLRENDEDSSLWKFRKDGEALGIRVDGVLSSNDGELIRQWALAGHGIMIRSQWDVSAEIANGKLVRLLQDHALNDADVVLLVDAASEQRQRTKRFVEHLAANLSPAPWESNNPRKDR